MKAEGFDVIAADATDFDLGRQFDAVVCGEVIEHVLNAGGLMRSLELTAVPHPGIEVGDTIAVVFVTGSRELHRVTDVTLPLTAGDPMRLQTRTLPW
jgi:2-polyprenyl-3-methyl-5-hydroxy-6-metoxy-1,4-benzoquinol methylase